MRDGKAARDRYASVWVLCVRASTYVWSLQYTYILHKYLRHSVHSFVTTNDGVLVTAAQTQAPIKKIPGGRKSLSESMHAVGMRFAVTLWQSELLDDEITLGGYLGSEGRTYVRLTPCHAPVNQLIHPVLRTAGKRWSEVEIYPCTTLATAC